MKMKKIAVLLSVILAVQGFIPDTALFASETASGNEAYATVIEDGGGAEAIGYEAPEVEEAETEEEDSISSDCLDADDTAAEIQWPSNATTVSAGSYDRIYKYRDGRGYGFAFWVEGGNSARSELNQWDKDSIIIRIDAQQIIKADSERVNDDGSRVYFNAGFLPDSISTGLHAIEVAVKKNDVWMTGSFKAEFKDETTVSIDTVIRHEVNEYEYFSAKKDGFIRKFQGWTNLLSDDDEISSVILCKSGSDTAVATGDIRDRDKYTGRPDVHYLDYDFYGRNWYMVASMPYVDSVIYCGVDFTLQEAVSEGWYDILITNTSGLKTRFKNAYYATNKPVVYYIGSQYFTPPLALPGSGRYVSRYVYGINIPGDGSLMPVLYKDNRRVSGEAYGIEPNGQGWGMGFRLKKADDEVWSSSEEDNYLNLKAGIEGIEWLTDVRTDLNSQELREKGINDYWFYNGDRMGLIGSNLLLDEKWVKGADEIGVIGYTGDKEVFSEKCSPVKYCDGGCFIHLTKKHESYADFIDGEWIYSTYKLYKTKDGKKEYSDSFYYDFIATDSIHTPISDILWEETMDDMSYWHYDGWWRPDHPEVRFAITPVDSMEVIAAGEVDKNKSILGCLTDSEERETVSSMPFMRVLFYDPMGMITHGQYILGDGSEPEEDEFEEVIPVKGKIALEAPDFAVAKWKSSNKGIASVNKYGVVTGKSAGKALITAIGKGTNPYNKNYTIYVEKPVLKNATLYNWDSFNINRKVSGVSRLKPVGYDSSDPSVLSIDDSGNVTVKKGGRSKLTIYYKYGSVSSAYTVKLPCFKKGEISMLESKTKKLSVVNKNSASSIVFTSSNEEVATVAYNGTITAISPGFTKISLLVNGEVYDVCKVTVLKPLIDQRSINLKPGKSMKLKLLNKSKNTVLVSSDNTVATVTQGGKVRGISKGTAVISTKIDGTVYDTCTVTVY